MKELRVKLLHPNAKPPVCANPSQDLGYDVFASEDMVLNAGYPRLVSTGIALELPGWGFLVRDRSSMAAKGVTVSGGVIDAGYRGEIKVIMTGNLHIKAGDKIAQLIPVWPQTGYPVVVVEDLSDTSRGAAGFGSTGN